MMNRQLEVRWIAFLSAVLIAVVGLVTKFWFGESLDVQIHDTYFVIDNIHLLVATGLVLIVANFLTLGLKGLATLHMTLKMLSVLVTGLVALGFVALVWLTATEMVETPTAAQHALSYGMLVLWAGLGMLFVLRTAEILKEV